MVQQTVTNGKAVRLTARQLNRATLARQMLLHRESVDVVDAVRRIVALQAQEAASPYLALWNRLAGFDPAYLDAAFLDQRVVKASLMRITLHAVPVDDYPLFHAAMTYALRGSRLHDDRFRRTGLSIQAADALVPELIGFTRQPRTSAECEIWVDERVGVLPKPGAWWALKTYAPLLHAPAGPPWTFGRRPSFLASRVPIHSGDRDQALQHLILRYLAGFGPASVQDVGQFTILPRPMIREALSPIKDTLVHLIGPDGKELLDVPGGDIPDEDTPAPARLMGMWDSTLLAYADRSRIIPPEYRKLVIRVNGDVLPALLVDGYAAGVWRPMDGGIEATAFHPLSKQTWDERSEEHTSELQSRQYLVCRLLLEKKNIL